MEKRELVILGAGPAGLAAAVYGRRADLDTLILEKGAAGGQINITDEIENWPGTIHSTGSELGETFRKHAEHFKAEFRSCTVQNIEIRNGHKIVVTDKGEIEAEAIIIATGASFRKLGCPGEAEFTGAGVSYCAVCDAAFFEGETVAVVGGGNVAVEEAGYLTRFADKVYFVRRRDEWRADRHAIDQALANPKIVPVWNSVVESIEGEGVVEKLVLKNVKTGEISDLPVAGCFVFVGTEPNVSFLKENELVKQSKGGWIVTNDKMETSVEGIYAAGDVRDKFRGRRRRGRGDGGLRLHHRAAPPQLRAHRAEEVIALITSSIDQDQVKLQVEAEAYAKESGKKIAFIDGYRNGKMVEKLGIAELPAIIEMKKGTMARSAKPASIDDVKNFVA